ncbi:Concanavalin A-like lectin/glucanases superfamily protein [Mariniphaga anaerophila]|uniref:Concanavalin A-like lectin/glucanases superfamily protein n=1 Tax=Mariniphaga anaerophila TaxID=1484053 RepID=A0A1M5FKV5_9BACT|nr:beta-L-arabinofuranosidase domain-containing protein [Mariniphaga anaerophila]SHF92160.1 Concanavalin A-like lectin/glucanases superfamily protein [Mariniphaga anaerophila]
MNKLLSRIMQIQVVQTKIYSLDSSQIYKILKQTKINKLMLFIVAIFFIWTPTLVFAQNGDQILDGIGETALICRYKFDGNTKDWSRNNLHGSVKGDFEFVADNQFGKVLSLPGNIDSYVSIPAETLRELETMSISGWIYLRSQERGQVLLDFGKNDQQHFWIAPNGTKETRSFLAQITAPVRNYQTSNTALAPYVWSHLAVVIDIHGKSLRTYVNGTLVSETNNVEMELNNLFDNTSIKNNKLYIGKSISAESSYLNAKLHDLRIYRIALTQNQVSGIYNNALRIEDTSVRTRIEPERGVSKFSEDTPQLYTTLLSEVPDIEVETVVGVLPRLPRFVQGIYKNNFKGPEVRVVWPAPKDNSAVLSPGKYILSGRISGTDIQPNAIVTVKNAKQKRAPERTLEIFDLNQVTLEPDCDNHKTKFIENRDKFILGLSKTNPDDFLYMFRNTFGQKQPEGAEPLGVWDSQETKLRGHATGHYLSGIAQAYASTGYDTVLRANFGNKMEYMVNTLYELAQLSGQPKMTGGESIADPVAVPPGPGKTGFNSDLSEEGIRTDYWNWGNGYISAYPPDQFIMLEGGAKYGTDNDKVWAPYYTLHKILAGLMDIYEVSDNKKALDISSGMGDWVHARLSQLPTQTLINMWNSYIAGEFGGMNEAMARLSRLSGKAKYMETARLFDNIQMFYGDAEHSHGLVKNVDMFRGLHANQHIPQIIGALEVYRDLKTPEYYHIADNFWDMTTNDYMYSIGGVAGASHPANAECFTSQPSTLFENGFSAGGQNETCATYNMLKLTRNLFLFDHRADFMDYYERGLYNHILASVAEDSPANTYHVPLNPGAIKHFGNAHMDGFTCCNGTALESSTKLQNSIYFKSADNKALYINLYIPSTLNWTEKNISVSQKTAYPKQDFTVLTIKGNAKFAMKVRVPKWATKGFFVKINGIEEDVIVEPGSYLTLKRKWKDGDTVELRMPFSFYLEPVMDQQNIASLFYGPVLLAAQEEGPRKDWRKVTLYANDISKSISGNPEKLMFNIDGVVFKPFYETYGRHSVYLDVTLK